MFRVIRNAVAKARGKRPTALGAYALRVGDMTCQHCAKSIKEAVVGLPGVKSVDANPTTKLVSFEIEDTADRQALAEAIAKAGFHPEGVES